MLPRDSSDIIAETIKQGLSFTRTENSQGLQTRSSSGSLNPHYIAKFLIASEAMHTRARQRPYPRTFRRPHGRVSIHNRTGHFTVMAASFHKASRRYDTSTGPYAARAIFLHNRTGHNSLSEQVAFAKQCGDSTHSPAHGSAWAVIVHNGTGYDSLSEQVAFAKQGGDITHSPAHPSARAFLVARQNRVQCTIQAGSFRRASR